MAGLPVDCLPVGFWFHFLPEDRLGIPEGPGEPSCAQAHLDYYNAVDVDLVKIMSDGYFDYPNPTAKAARQAKDWYAMQPLGVSHPFFHAQVERAKRVRDGLKEERVVLYNVFAPFSSLRHAATDALVMRHLREDPQAVMHALDIVAQDNAALCGALCAEAGCDGVYYSVQGGETGRMTHEEYRAWITPSDLAVLQRANSLSACNMLHCCGWAGERNRLENWRDYPAQAVNWAVYVEGLPISRGREFFGGRCVLGGFDNRKAGIMYRGSRRQVEAATLALLEEMPETGAIIGADCTLPGDIDPARITWVVDAVKKRADGSCHG
jgi:uroporphyrinogen-III decarboxylase